MNGGGVVDAERLRLRRAQRAPGWPSIVFVFVLALALALPITAVVAAPSVRSGPDAGLDGARSDAFLGLSIAVLPARYSTRSLIARSTSRRLI